MKFLPFTTPESFKDGLKPEDEKKELWFIFSNEQLLVGKDLQELPSQCVFSLAQSLFVGTLGEYHLFAAEVQDITLSESSLSWQWSSLRQLYGVLKEEHYACAGRALQLLHWHRRHALCGACGASTFMRTHERCLECTICGELFYPQLAPAIMALVKKGSHILLARGAHFPGKMYSVLAGYVDPGETLEQCVAREVLEEVGLHVKNICYFGSQPWPFSRSLMIGFTCEWESGEICRDPIEIEAADFFALDNLPELPSTLSLARIMIDAVLSLHVH